MHKCFLSNLYLLTHLGKQQPVLVHQTDKKQKPKCGFLHALLMAWQEPHAA